MARSTFGSDEIAHALAEAGSCVYADVRGGWLRFLAPELAPSSPA